MYPLTLVVYQNFWCRCLRRPSSKDIWVKLLALSRKLNHLKRSYVKEWKVAL